MLIRIFNIHNILLYLVPIMLQISYAGILDTDQNKILNSVTKVDEVSHNKED